MAVKIAMGNDTEVQQALQQAYEKKLLRGHKLIVVKRLVEQRRRSGKGWMNADHKRERPLSVERLLRTYRDDTDKKRRLVRKAETTRDRLIFVTEGLRKLLADDNFVTLLRAEGLDTLPRNLGDRLQVNR
jgi:ParB family chromosome partitioning protein